MGQRTILYVVLLFVGLFLTGYGLARMGKPYSSILFNLHKLVGIGIVVYLAVLVRRAHLAGALTPVEILVVVVTALLFLATIASGGLSSLERPTPKPASVAHNVLPYLTVAGSAVWLYLLAGR